MCGVVLVEWGLHPTQHDTPKTEPNKNKTTTPTHTHSNTCLGPDARPAEEGVRRGERPLHGLEYLLFFFCCLSGVEGGGVSRWVGGWMDGCKGGLLTTRAA